MIKEAIAGKSLLAVGAAVAFCGLTLYAVGQTLDYLFRDVDPNRIEQAPEDEAEVIETEDPIPDPS